MRGIEWETDKKGGGGGLGLKKFERWEGGNFDPLGIFKCLNHQKESFKHSNRLNQVKKGMGEFLSRNRIEFETDKKKRREERGGVGGGRGAWTKKKGLTENRGILKTVQVDPPQRAQKESFKQSKCWTKLKRIIFEFLSKSGIEFETDNGTEKKLRAPLSLQSPLISKPPPPFRPPRKSHSKHCK